MAALRKRGSKHPFKRVAKRFKVKKVWMWVLLDVYRSTTRLLEDYHLMWYSQPYDL